MKNFVSSVLFVHCCHDDGLRKASNQAVASVGNLSRPLQIQPPAEQMPHYTSRASYLFILLLECFYA